MVDAGVSRRALSRSIPISIVTIPESPQRARAGRPQHPSVRTTDRGRTPRFCGDVRRSSVRTTERGDTTQHAVGQRVGAEDDRGRVGRGGGGAAGRRAVDCDDVAAGLAVKMCGRTDERAQVLDLPQLVQSASSSRIRLMPRG